MEDVPLWVLVVTAALSPVAALAGVGWERWSAGREAKQQRTWAQEDAWLARLVDAYSEVLTVANASGIWHRTASKAPSAGLPAREMIELGIRYTSAQEHAWLLGADPAVQASMARLQLALTALIGTPPEETEPVLDEWAEARTATSKAMTAHLRRLGLEGRAFDA